MDFELLDAAKPAAIYCLIDPRRCGWGRFRYVGKTERRLDQRLRRHVFDAQVKQKAYHVSYWLRSLLEAGIAPAVTLLELTSRVAAAERECMWITHLRGLGCPLTNLTDGGDGTVGHKTSNETRARLSAANTGKKHSPAARAKMSAAHTGKKLSPETRAKMMGNKYALGSKGPLGQHPSLETRAKMGAAHKGKKQSPEHIAKRVAAVTGVKRGSYSPEHRARISAALTGVERSPATRAKNSAWHKGRKLLPEHCAKIASALKGRTPWNKSKTMLAAVE